LGLADFTASVVIHEDCEKWVSHALKSKMTGEVVRAFDSKGVCVALLLALSCA